MRRYALALADLYLALDEYQNAREHFEEALSLVDGFDNRQLEAGALSGLMRTYMRLDKSSMVAIYGDRVCAFAQEIGQPELEIARLISGTILSRRASRGGRFPL